MAHYRKPVVATAALNTALYVDEALPAFHTRSLSLLMDSIHNFSDEIALVFLLLAFLLPTALSRNLY